MEKLKQHSFLLVIPAIFVIAFLIGNYRSEKEKSSISCKNEEITPELVKNLGGDYDDEMVKQINMETPYCKDLCNQQLDYSKKYDDWFAEDDLRGKCTELGINLPPNK